MAKQITANYNVLKVDTLQMLQNPVKRHIFINYSNTSVILFPTFCLNSSTFLDMSMES